VDKYIYSDGRHDLKPQLYVATPPTCDICQSREWSLRVEFEGFQKTDSGYPMDARVTNSPCQTLEIPFALTPIGQV